MMVMYVVKAFALCISMTALVGNSVAFGQYRPCGLTDNPSRKSFTETITVPVPVRQAHELILNLLPTFAADSPEVADNRIRVEIGGLKKWPQRVLSNPFQYLVPKGIASRGSYDIQLYPLQEGKVTKVSLTFSGFVGALAKRGVFFATPMAQEITCLAKILTDGKADSASSNNSGPSLHPNDTAEQKVVPLALVKTYLSKKLLPKNQRDVDSSRVRFQVTNDVYRGTEILIRKGATVGARLVGVTVVDEKKAPSTRGSALRSQYASATILRLMMNVAFDDISDAKGNALKVSARESFLVTMKEKDSASADAAFVDGAAGYVVRLTNGEKNRLIKLQGAFDEHTVMLPAGTLFDATITMARN